MMAAGIDLNILAAACDAADAAAGPAALQAALADCLPGLQFQPVLCRAGWHRLGGVLDADRQRVTDDIRGWLEGEAGDDLEGFVVRHHAHGLVATRVQGRTHYLTADTGEAPEAFVQLEVEELQEVTDRLLLPADWLPDDIEDLLDPMQRETLPAEPVAAPRFVFRRVVAVPELLHSSGDRLASLKRFMYDWDASSAARSGRFAGHWVLSLREDRGSDGDAYLSAKPVPATAPAVDLSPYNGNSGEALLDDIRRFDQAQGYAFAWFFHMLTSRAVPFQVGEAVLADLAADYAYLPPRDALILSAWANRRYAV